MRGNGTDGAIHHHMFNGDQERTAQEMLKPRNSHEAFQRAHRLSVSNGESFRDATYVLSPGIVSAVFSNGENRCGAISQLPFHCPWNDSLPIRLQSSYAESLA